VGALVSLAQEPAHRLAQHFAVQAARWGSVRVACPDKP
jgi:hypothetical protein